MRLKLLKVNLPLAFPDLAAIFSNHRYKEVERGAKGFEIFESNNNVLDARFISKKVEEGYVLGPFGDEEKVVNVSFDFFEFVLWRKSNGAAFLLLKNPPRGLKLFFQEMQNVLGGGFSVSEISFSLLAFMEALASIKGANYIKIDKVKVSGLVINKKSHASVEVGSSDNALEEMEKFLEDRVYNLDKIKFESFFGGLSFKCEASKSGSIIVPEAFFDYMGEEMQEILVSSCLEK